MCSSPHLQYHFDQYELDCPHRDTPREVHEQRFAGSSFAHHLLQSNTNFQALPLANAQSRAPPPLPGTAQRYRLGVAFSSSARRACCTTLAVAENGGSLTISSCSSGCPSICIAENSRISG